MRRCAPHYEFRKPLCGLRPRIAGDAPSNWQRARWETLGGRADQPVATDFEAVCHVFNAVRAPKALPNDLFLKLKLKFEFEQKRSFAPNDLFSNLSLKFCAGDGGGGL